MMRLYVITESSFAEQEADIIRTLLLEGIDRVHLRKPHSDEESMRRLLDAIPGELHPRLTLQDHPGLAAEYGVGGIHLNSRNPQPPAEPRYAKNPQHAFEEQSSSGPQRFSEPAGLWPRIYRAGKTACSLEQLCRNAMAKQFTLSAAQRTILSAFLQLPSPAELPPYLHVLALNRRGADVLKIAKKTAKLPILHNFTPQHLKDPSLRAAILAEQRADDKTDSQEKEEAKS